jgi:hypothetical protein
VVILTLVRRDFATYYIPAIDLAISRDDRFILGDAQGTDTIALNYLLQHGGPAIKHRITIYPSKPYNVAKFEDMGITASTDPAQSLQLGNAQNLVKGLTRSISTTLKWIA